MYLPKAGWKKLCYSLLFMLAGLAGRAQIYPVDVSTQVTPPYDVYLPDYASPGGEKLRIVLLQRDLAVQGYRLRFEMKIQDNGVTIMQTSKSAMPPPITLQPGIPTVLGGSDLSWYVQPQNLEFGGGYSAATYEQTRALPEGPITITFTAYDYIRSDVQVSLPSSTSFYASLDNPPLLNYPACGMQIAPISPQFINFGWLPQNTSSPNSALQTNYVFSLWAILPAGYSYQDIVQSAAPIFTTTVQQPNFVYGPGQPMLTPGQQYAWRIQAVDASGRDLFANNGFSQTCNFIYGGDSSQGIINYPDIQINAAAVGSAQGKVWWTGDNGGSLDTSGYTQYELYYRQSQGDNAWFSDTVSDTMYRLFNLEPNTAYECRIQGYKDGTYGPYSGIATFTTAAQQAVSCTDSVSMLNPSSGSPLAIASPGMTLTYGPWNVTLTTVQPVGPAGQFKGTCTVSIPFMGGTSFYATFNNLTIDDSRNVTAGNINFVSQSMQSFVDSSINSEMGGSLYGKVVSGTDTTNVNVPVSLANITQLPVTLGPDSTIASFTIPGNPPVVVTVNDSLEEVTIKDSTGSTYALNNQGQLTQLTLANGSLQNFFGNPANVTALDTLATGMGVVNFRDADSKYAFDTWQPFYSSASTILTSQYQLLTGGSGNYYVAQKAIGAGASDIVGVSISLAPGMTADSLIFSTGTGTQLIWDPSDSTLDLLGGPAADAQNVYALYPKPGGGYYSLGKLLVSAYEQQNFTAVLVPVVAGDGAVPTINVQQIEDSLNSIYNKVNVNWTVVVDSAYNNVAAWDASGDGFLTMTGSSLLSNKLVGEPAALMKSYMSARSMNKNEPYLFVLNTSKGSTGDPGGAAGDMPRGEQYGFIFLNQAGTPDQAAVVAAHELGHGQFNLEHTFSGDIALAQGATAAWPNLMDYVSSNARRLYKYQWGQIHQPGQVLGIFESDSASQSLGQPYLRCIHDAGIIAGLGNTFYDPVGNVIQLDDDMTPYAFFGSKEGSIYGNLAAFKKDGQTYLYLLYASGPQKGQYGNVFGTIDGTGKMVTPTIIHGTAQAVKISSSNVLNGVTLADCNCNDLATFIKPASAVTIGNLKTGKLKTGASSGNGNDSTDSAGQDIMLCASDPFDEPHQLLVQYADGTTTWGQTIVRQLNTAIAGNKVNSFGSDPLAANLSGVSYVLTGQDYQGNSVFQGGYTLDELNHKMAYLEISKGYQFYTRFIQTNCTFTQQVADNFAQEVLDSSNVDQAKGIICLVLFNGNAPAGDPQQYTIGMAFGTGVAEATSIRGALNATSGNAAQSIVGSLINAYQLIPKKRTVYSYFIGTVTQRSKERRLYKLTHGDGEPTLKDTIWDVVDVVNNSTGNVIAAEYNIVDTVSGKILNQIIDDGKALKEEYVTTDGLNVAINYGIRYAGWDMTYLPEGQDEPKDSTPVLIPCDFTLSKPCDQVAIDDAFLIATLVVPERYALLPIGAAIIYYSATGQPNMVGTYLDMYGLSKLLGPALEGATSLSSSMIKLGARQLKNFTLGLKMSRIIGEGLTEDAIQALYQQQLDNTCAEYFIPDANSKNLWIKTFGTADGEVTSVLVGTVQGTNLVLKGYETGTNYIIESIDESHLAQIASDAIKAQELVDAGILSKEEFFPQAISNIATLQNASKLTNTGSATTLQLQAIDRYTINGDILNVPFRGTGVTDLSPVTLDPTQQALYDQLIGGLAQLRKTSRLYTDYVYRGRAYDPAEFAALFKGVNTEVPLQGFQSASTKDAVATVFVKDAAPSKIRVIMKIKSVKGVFIDDLSAHGSILGPTLYPRDIIQNEVLMEEGYFMQVGIPQSLPSSDGTTWYMIEMLELAKPFR